MTHLLGTLSVVAILFIVYFVAKRLKKPNKIERPKEEQPDFYFFSEISIEGCCTLSDIKLTIKERPIFDKSPLDSM